MDRHRQTDYNITILSQAVKRPTLLQLDFRMTKICYYIFGCTVCYTECLYYMYMVFQGMYSSNTTVCKVMDMDMWCVTVLIQPWDKILVNILSNVLLYTLFFSSANAYMLMYRQVKENEVTFMLENDLPDHVKNLVVKLHEEEKREQELKDWQRSVCKVSF